MELIATVSNVNNSGGRQQSHVSRFILRRRKHEMPAASCSLGALFVQALAKRFKCKAYPCSQGILLAIHHEVRARNQRQAPHALCHWMAHRTCPAVQQRRPGTDSTPRLAAVEGERRCRPSGDADVVRAGPLGGSRRRLRRCGGACQPKQGAVVGSDACLNASQSVISLRTALCQFRAAFKEGSANGHSVDRVTGTSSFYLQRRLQNRPGETLGTRLCGLNMR